ncbi:MAG: PQQ-binding-like beta-propeller repeat protein [Pontiellaceae bacterium]|nr:PQQ-binding-like beta-propeller repeat protein [Pontiellaceae bacterium]
MMNRYALRFLVVGLLGLAAGASAEDWSQWRGRAYNGTSPATGLPDSLGEEQQLWVTDLPGPGEATPAICDGVIYLSGYDEAGKTLFAMQVNAADGAVLWKKTVASYDKLPSRNVIASPSPVADEKGAVFMFSNGIVVRYSREGEELWRKDLFAEYGPYPASWSYSSSPLLHDGTLFIPVLRLDELPRGSTYEGSMESYLLGLDAESGAVKFKVDRPTDAKKDFRELYGSPIPVQMDGKTQILLYGGNYITSHDPKTGKELWRSGYMDIEMSWGRVATTPVVADNIIYCAFPSGEKAFARDLEKMAKGEDGLVWVYDEPASDVPSPVVWKGSLYLVQESKKQLLCIDIKTGELRWSGRLERGDTFYASPTVADDKIYIVNRKGFLTVVAADPEEFRILSTRAFNENPTDSTIAISNGKLFLRTSEHLYCFGDEQTGD